MIDFKFLTLSPFAENTYIVFDTESRDAVIVDPGCSNDYEQQLVLNTLTELKVKVLAVVNTHCHLDHIFGNKFLTEKFSVPLYIPEKDEFLLRIAVKQGEMFGIPVEESPKPAGYLPEDGDWSIGSLSFATIFTPGHTPGEICLFAQKEKLLFAGDVLFNGSIGRTDLWGGDMDTLLNSISTKLFSLPHDTRVFPGHGEETTIGNEISSNPFFQ